MVDATDFFNVDIRVGTILEAEVFEGLRNPAYKILVDFGEEIGLKRTSAQVTELYQIEDLINKKILGVVNFPPKQIKNFFSEFLILGVYGPDGVNLVVPDKEAQNGEKLG